MVTIINKLVLVCIESVINYKDSHPEYDFEFLTINARNLGYLETI